MTKQLPKPRKMMQVHKTFLAKDYAPEALLNTYTEQNKTLQATKEAIGQCIVASPEFKTLVQPSVLSVTNVHGALAFETQHKIETSDDVQRKSASTSKYIEPSTMNLLMNTKILTQQEKRALLKEHGMLPKVAEEPAKMPEEDEGHNDDGVPMHGGAAMIQGWDDTANPHKGQNVEASLRWLRDWHTANHDAFVGGME